MPSVTFTQTVSFTAFDCPECGLNYALTDAFVNRKRDTGEPWYCPHGHSQSFRDGNASKLKAALRELAQKQAEVAYERSRADMERRIREQREADLKRHKRRAANGVCGCCNRSFTNLRRHMATQHPEQLTKS